MMKNNTIVVFDVVPLQDIKNREKVAQKQKY